MTELLLSAPVIHGQAARCCDRAPCFQARLEAAAGRRPVRGQAEICAEHLGPWPSGRASTASRAR